MLHAQERLVFSLPAASKETIGTRILKEAYGRLGISIEVRHLSSNRSLILSSSGQVDGEVVRIAKIDEEYPTLKKINVPLRTIDITVFVRSSEKAEISLENFSQTRVGYVSGLRFFDNYTRSFPRVSTAQDRTELFRLLQWDRVDAVLADRYLGSETLKSLSLDNIEPLAESLITIPLYHFLHQKHVQLVPKIEAVLLDMRATGELARLQEWNR